MGQPVFQSRAAELAGLGSSVFQAVEPTTLAELDVPLSSAVACLAFLSSARSFWDAHSLVIGYAMDTVSGDAAETELDQFLSQRDGLVSWIADGAVLAYSEQVRLETPLAVLNRAAAIIDAGLDRAGYRDAQVTSVRILYCHRRCGEDVACFRECLHS